MENFDYKVNTENSDESKGGTFLIRIWKTDLIWIYSSKNWSKADKLFGINSSWEILTSSAARRQGDECSRRVVTAIIRQLSATHRRSSWIL